MDNNRKMQEIVKRIKKRREDLNLSYQDLANRTGFGKSTLQRYETGSIKTMPIDRFEQLAKALEIEPYKLMGWDVQDILYYDNEYEEDSDIIDLYRNYNKLDEYGKSKLLEYSFDLIATKKYSKDNCTEISINKSSNSINLEASKTTDAKNGSSINNNSIDYMKAESDDNIINSSSDYNNNSLAENFTTIAAHDDGLDKNEIKEMDDIFFKKLLEKNKKL